MFISRLPFPRMKKMKGNEKKASTYEEAFSEIKLIPIKGVQPSLGIIHRGQLVQIHEVSVEG